MSKHAGALIFIVGTLILGLFAFGAYLRQKTQQAAVADFGSKNVAPATSAGTEIAKEIPSGGVPLSRTAAAPPPTPGDNLVPLEEVKALANVPMPPTGEHVIVRQRNARHPRHALAAAVFRRIRSGVIAALVVVIGRRGGLAQ